MSAEKVKTYYSAVEHLESFWKAVFNFIALEVTEGEEVAQALITDCVDKSALRDNGTELEYAPCTSALQEQPFDSLWAFLNDPALPPNYEAFEAVWVTAKV